MTAESTPELTLDAGSGWLNGARHVASPNCDARPPNTAIELLVIHGISLPPGEYGGDGIDRLFTNTLDPTQHPFFQEVAGLRVSSHLLVDRAGQLTQYVSLLDRAWHAGVSCFQGRAGCNDFSIGIELEGTDDDPYTAAQYQTLAAVTRLLREQYPALTDERIAGHCDIAPERKTDPGPAFDWHHYLALINEPPTNLNHKGVLV